MNPPGVKGRIGMRNAEGWRNKSKRIVMGEDDDV